MWRFSIEPSGDLDLLGERWRALEREADGGFFRSWTFLGCLAHERFPDARLLAVTDGDEDVALALLGRARGRFWLNQTGSPVHDGVFIEHNGLLIRRELHPALPVIQGALAEASRQGGTLVLSGIDEPTLQAACHAGWLVERQARFAPAVPLERSDAPYLDSLSANARAQIRRSQRLYGPGLALEAARTVAEAHAMFDELAALHQASWNRRGQPGAFATHEAGRFHRALIGRAWPAQADLLRVAAGGRVIGLLYNLLQDGRVLAYQSGLEQPGGPQEKPGLVCHALAIEHYRTRDFATYDLLAGDDRYKRTLARGGETLHWATLHRPWSASGLVARSRSKLRDLRARDRSAPS